MNSIPERLDLVEEALKKSFDHFDWNLRVSSPGYIVSFNEAKQTAVVQLAVTEMIKCNDPKFLKKNNNSNVGPVWVPQLQDVPICFPTAGGFSITFPIKANDECLVVFSDTCFDAWYQNGCAKGPQDQMSLRRHDLSDAVAIVGINSLVTKLTNYSTSALQIRSDDGTIYIEISSSGITIKAPLVNLGDTTGLYKLIDERFKDLFNNHTHVVSGIQTGSGSVTTAVTATPIVLASHATSKTVAK